MIKLNLLLLASINVTLCFAPTTSTPNTFGFPISAMRENGSEGQSQKDSDDAVGIVIAVVVLLILFFLGVQCYGMYYYHKNKGENLGVNKNSNNFEQRIDIKPINNVSKFTKPSNEGLPENWTKHYDEEGTPYYWNSKTNKPSWFPPETKLEERLPENWTKLYDQNGTPYYWNTKTNKAAWKLPESAETKITNAPPETPLAKRPLHPKIPKRYPMGESVGVENGKHGEVSNNREKPLPKWTRKASTGKSIFPRAIKIKSTHKIQSKTSSRPVPGKLDPKIRQLFTQKSTSNTTITTNPRSRKAPPPRRKVNNLPRRKVAPPPPRY